ncbi:MFS transporter [Pseudomonas sp. KNUC1026]|uniref:MFS transporter n=1 Tax=Pseudomonas sp. KNUC1026 TaxID=2893890 RepID=UPI001F331F34|nr:MFS transporter [Pseudomonas sp. KNUC1026]UFH48164.1 MFS transporter [Pseudomonas sp. KNUC1026]
MPAHTPSARARHALDALNFTLADVRDGLGPYLAIYLIAVRGPQEGWNEATAGLVMTLAGIAGLVAQTPAGALIDRTRGKRGLLLAATLVITLCCVTLPWVSNFWVVAATQSLAQIAGAVFAPALAAITLGIVGARHFTRHIGRNEGFNHAGNAFSAALAAGLAYVFGPLVVFWLMAALAAASLMAIWRLPADEIDDDLARGMAAEQHDKAPVSAWQALLSNRKLMLLAVLAALFHLANAAMLTSVGQQLTHIVGKSSATSLIALCIVAAQCVMVPVAIAVGRCADRIGRKPIFLLAFAILALRGGLYTLSPNPWYLVAVQCLDGVGAGIYGALMPVVIADLTHGSGRFNVSQGAIATAQGLGAALSATLAGFIIVGVGYEAAFLALAAVAVMGGLLYAWRMPETGPAHAG